MGTYLCTIGEGAGGLEDLPHQHAHKWQDPHKQIFGGCSNIICPKERGMRSALVCRLQGSEQGDDFKSVSAPPDE